MRKSRIRREEKRQREEKMERLDGRVIQKMTGRTRMEVGDREAKKGARG